ncbi:hypothetical protein Nepgr_014752 [Nepenthes gracilis]|uniref:Uncharacterized protein n=1 Tax=Nepenthes gracilis TaxID=150966 RepID=A0AAD3SMF1_NEPGR|nr:hypothetical protein Nepgr_014752 [Nepenthes gracilis]
MDAAGARSLGMGVMVADAMEVACCGWKICWWKTDVAWFCLEAKLGMVLLGVCVLLGSRPHWVVGGRALHVDDNSLAHGLPAGLWMCDGSWLPVVKSGNFCSGLASMFCTGLIFFSWLGSYLLLLRMWLDLAISCHLWGLLALALKLLVLRLGRPSWLCGVALFTVYCAAGMLLLKLPNWFSQLWLPPCGPVYVTVS